MISAALDTLLDQPSTVLLSPGFEGANIGTYIGFKHVNYVVERAVIEHFRSALMPVGRLYERFGLGFDVVELESRLRGGLFVDDQVEARVTPRGDRQAGVFVFAVELTLARDDVPRRIVTATVRAVLRRDDDDRRLPDRRPVPAELAPFVRDRIEPLDSAAADAGPAVPGPAAALAVSGASTEDDPVLDQLLAGRNGYGWRFRIPYPYVHFFSRMHMASYLRQMEEAKHRFVAARGLSIGDQLAERNWIPAVTRSRIRVLGEALLEEELYTTYVVSDVFKRLLYTAEMDCYVVRGGRLHQVATGTITHGYGVVENGNEARMVEFDDAVLAALAGSGRSRG